MSALALALAVLRRLADWRIVAALSVVLSLGLTWIEARRVTTLKTELGAARAAALDPSSHKTWRSEAAAAAAENRTMRADLAAQSAAVAQLQARTEVAQKAAAHLAATAQARAGEAESRSKAILATPVAASDDDCASARAIDKTFLEQLQ